MQRRIEHGVRGGRLSRACLGAVATMILLLALPSLASAATQTLTVNKVGTGTGTVTSSPAGIECGGTCLAPFNEGSTVTLKGVAGTNTASVVWSGPCKLNLENACLVTMSAAEEVTATFNLIERKLTVEIEGPGTGTVTSSPAGLSCSSSCSASFVKGTAVTLSATPDPGVLPVVWTGCESVTEGKCLVTMSGVKTVTATFGLPSFELSVSKGGNGTGTVTSSPAGIECGSTCSAGFVKGTKVTLTASFGPHTIGVKWTGCDNVVAGQCLVAVNSAHSVIATFQLDPLFVEYTVTVVKKGTGKGTVSSIPGGIDCGEDCSETYVGKTHLKLIATPASGSVFDHWSGGSCSGSGVCEKTINSSRTVKAVFVADGKRTLTVSRAGTGTGTVTGAAGAIACGSKCSAEFDAGAKVTLTATAAQGSVFSGWSGACTGATDTCKLQMSEARGVTATFTKLASPGSEVFVSSTGKVRGGKALLRVACNGPSPCKGTLKLLLKIRNAQGQVKGLVVGTASFSLGAESVRTLAVKLSSRAMRLLAESGRVRLRVAGAGESHAVRLSQPAR